MTPKIDNLLLSQNSRYNLGRGSHDDWHGIVATVVGIVGVDVLRGEERLCALWNPLKKKKDGKVTLVTTIEMSSVNQNSVALPRRVQFLSSSSGTNVIMPPTVLSCVKQ